MSTLRVMAAIAALSAVACSAGWVRHPIESPEPLPPRQQVQVWQAGHATLLHRLRIDSATVTGIPYHKSLDCDSCLVVIPRAAVDSLRLGDLSNGLWKSVALVGGALIVTGIVICAKGGCEAID